jgi:hypothetical protein
MEKHSSPMMQLVKRRAAFRLRQLLDGFHLLTGSFFDLHDAFDPDELPLAFIVRRDARLIAGRVQHRSRFHHASTTRFAAERGCPGTRIHRAPRSRHAHGRSDAKPNGKNSIETARGRFVMSVGLSL